MTTSMKTSSRMSALVFLFLTSLAPAQQNGPIVGRWQYQSPQMEIAADFKADGSFYQINKTPYGQEEFRGRYSFNGTWLQIQPIGLPVQQIGCRLTDSETMILTYPTGEVIQARRVKTSAPPADGKPPAPSSPTSSARNQTPSEKSGPTSAKKPVRLLLQRVWEVNEKAFTVLVPQGWKTSGGVFNVNPLRTNGPGNSISPKCDFAVKNDDRGGIMIRWMPTWNYADLTYSPSGFSLFRPGQSYQGMLVKVMPNPKTFLTEMLRKERPQATDFQVVAEDPMREVTQAFDQQTAALNLQLRQAGLGPLRFDSSALVVEYLEAGVRYRESLLTTIADNRTSAFQWSNENTIMFRAPAADFESWKPVLDMIQSSREGNPQWMAAVVRAVGERAKGALETQQYINRVSQEIVDNRRRTNAEIRHENWLFLTGQEEYKNPFTGSVERGSSEYRYRWQNNQGEVLYCDENSFDPNRREEYNTKEWKRSEVWDRKK
jgi:hypothetical protein